MSNVFKVNLRQLNKCSGFFEVLKKMLDHYFQIVMGMDTKKIKTCTSIGSNKVTAP